MIKYYNNGPPQSPRAPISEPPDRLCHHFFFPLLLSILLLLLLMHNKECIGGVYDRGSSKSLPLTDGLRSVQYNIILFRTLLLILLFFF